MYIKHLLQENRNDELAGLKPAKVIMERNVTDA